MVKTAVVPKVQHGNLLFEEYVSAQDMDASDRSLAQRIHDTYKDKHVVLVAIDNGGRITRDDLAANLKELGTSFELADMKISSYGAATKSSGDIHLDRPLNIDPQSKHILLVDDIDDTRLSIKWLRSYIREQHPASVAFAVGLSKQNVFKHHEPDPEFIGKAIDNVYVIGRGLDGAGDPASRKHRTLYKLVKD